MWRIRDVRSNYQYYHITEVLQQCSAFSNIYCMYDGTLHMH